MREQRLHLSMPAQKRKLPIAAPKARLRFSQMKEGDPITFYIQKKWALYVFGTITTIRNTPSGLFWIVQSATIAAPTTPGIDGHRPFYTYRDAKKEAHAIASFMLKDLKSPIQLLPL